MKIVNKMVINDLKLNKTRTIITIVGIVLATVLMTVVATMYTSIKKTLNNSFIEENGDFHVEFLNVPKDDLEVFRCNRKIDKVYVTSPVGYIRDSIEKNGRKDIPHTDFQANQIQAFTKEALDNVPIKLLDGRMPQNENEILVPISMKKKFEIGNEISFDLLDYRQENGALSDSFENSLLLESEHIKKTYKIVGMIEKQYYRYTKKNYITNEDIDYQICSYITYTSEDMLEGALNLYVRYTSNDAYSIKQNNRSILDIRLGEFDENEHSMSFTNIENTAKYAWRENERFDATFVEKVLSKGNISNQTSIEMVYLDGVVVFAFLIIFILSVFCIKGSFDISSTERKKLYALLKSIGSTEKQIKKSVLFESFLLGILGTLIGIVIGIATSYSFCILYNKKVADYMTLLNNKKMTFDVSLGMMIVVFILGICMTYLSELQSAIKVSKVNILESIKNSGNIGITPVNDRLAKIIRKVFGIGGEISYKNLKRNKEKYITTVRIIGGAVIIFIMSHTYLSIFSKIIDLKTYAYDFKISNFLVEFSSDENIYSDVFEEISKLDNIEEYTAFRTLGVDMDYDNKSNGGSSDGGCVYVIADEPYKKYVESLGLNYEEIKNEAILLNNVKKKNNSKYSNNYKIGDTFNFDVKKRKIEKDEENENVIYSQEHFEKQEYSIKVGYVTNEAPYAFVDKDKRIFFVSEYFYKEFIKDTASMGVEMYFMSKDVYRLEDDINMIFNRYNNDDYDIGLYTKNSKRKLDGGVARLILLKTSIYGFISILYLIGITSIINVITGNMWLRKNEFARLLSVGITKRQFKNMIRLEIIFTGIGSLKYSIPISIVLLYLSKRLEYLQIYLKTCKELKINFSPFMIRACVIAILFVFIIIYIIMKHASKKISKLNIIETIRNDNI